MKKKQSIHAKLYVDIVSYNSFYKYLYRQNKFNQSGDRIIEEEISNNFIDLKNIKDYLMNKNLKEYQKLKNYIKTQKKVLEKHQKARNYDAVNTLKVSIKTVDEFKNEFDDWFIKNK